jgi:eukaryotic-like serine/threonine-protein kinase
VGTHPGSRTLLSWADTLSLPGRGPNRVSPSPAPRRIGRYEVRGLLGEGAMGRVYRAYDPGTDREVAIKVLKAPFFADARVRRRFWREAELANRFAHPAFVAVHDLAEDHIVLELVSGESLAARLARTGPLPPSETLDVLSRVAGALDYIHSRGIVHRDIKPSNVMLAPGGRVRITDFGVAHLAWDPITRSGEMIGSPGYMSPEQITHGEVQPASDRHALAVVAYEILTGVPAFQAPSLGRLLERIVREMPASAASLNPSLPAALDAVFKTALAKNPGDRHTSNRAFVRALAKALEARPVARSLWSWLTGRSRAQPASPRRREADPYARTRTGRGKGRGFA